MDPLDSSVQVGLSCGLGLRDEGVDRSRRGLRRRLCAVRSRLCWVGRVYGVVRLWMLCRGVGIVGRSFRCCRRLCLLGDGVGLRVELVVFRRGRGVVCEGLRLYWRVFLVLLDGGLGLLLVGQLVEVDVDIGVDVELEPEVAVIEAGMVIAIGVVVVTVFAISIAVACFQRPVCID